MAHSFIYTVSGAALELGSLNSDYEAHKVENIYSDFLQKNCTDNCSIK